VEILSDSFCFVCFACLSPFPSSFTLTLNIPCTSDPSEMAEALKASCVSGTGKGLVSFLLLNVVHERDWTAFLTVARAAAANCEAWAQYAVGFYMMRSNRGEALRLLNQAADQGHVYALEELASVTFQLFLRSDDSPETGESVLKYCARAIEAGSSFARALLAVCHQRGVVAIINSDEAWREWRGALCSTNDMETYDSGPCSASPSPRAPLTWLDACSCPRCLTPCGPTCTADQRCENSW
jgi:hypothetical protein